MQRPGRHGEDSELPSSQHPACASDEWRKACMAGRGTHLDKLEVIVAELQPAGKLNLLVTDRLLNHNCMHPPNPVMRQSWLPSVCVGA